MDHNQQLGHRDPNRSKETNQKGDHIICKYCHAVYQNKKWEKLEKMDPKFVDQLSKGCCPACHLEKSHLSDGVLFLTGNVISAHKDEIKNLIHNIAEKEEERDFMNRVERIEESEPEKMVIYTTKNTLAVEIGKKIDSAYKGGKLDINFSKDDKPVDVRWHLDKE